jgi:redox-sensing transcriptional repressor
MATGDKQISFEIVMPEPTLRRLSVYHRFLKSLTGEQAVSCTRIGSALDLDPTQVRKDIEFTGIVGRPKVGYLVTDLMAAIERYLGWDNLSEAFLVGVGSLGAALLGYGKFEECGMKIVAGFDADERKIGSRIHGKFILPISELAELAQRMHVPIGIITVPAAQAQGVADLMVRGGMQAIWNFAPVQISVPENVILRNEDLYCSLAALSAKLTQRRLRKEPSNHVAG